MRRSHVFWSLGGLAALLAGYAVCHAFPYEPAKNPTPPPRTIGSPELPPSDPAPAGKPVAAPACCATGVKAPAAEAKAPACCAPSATPVTVQGFRGAGAEVSTLTFTAAAPVAKDPNVYDLLSKLEALKAKQDALESEVRETYALLNEKFRTLQMRMAKVGAGVPMVYPVPSYASLPPATCPAPVFPPAIDPTLKTGGLTKPAADDCDLPPQSSTGSKPLAPPRP